MTYCYLHLTHKEPRLGATYYVQTASVRNSIQTSIFLILSPQNFSYILKRLKADTLEHTDPNKHFRVLTVMTCYSHFAKYNYESIYRGN